MPKYKTITDAVAKKLKAPNEGQVDHFDSSLPGLALRVSSSGRKTWVYFIVTQASCAACPSMCSPRCLCRQLTPSGSRRETSCRLVEILVAFRKLVPPTSLASPRSGSAGIRRETDQPRSSPACSNERFSPLGSPPDLRHLARDVRDLIDAIVDRGHLRWPAVSTPAFTASSSGPRAATSSTGTRSQNMDNLEERVRRDRVFTDEDSSRSGGRVTSSALMGRIKLLILTGARREEIAKLRRNEIVRQLSRYPGERTKNGEPHIIPLSTAAHPSSATSSRRWLRVRAGLPTGDARKSSTSSQRSKPGTSMIFVARRRLAFRSSASRSRSPRRFWPHQRLSRRHDRRLSTPRLRRREARSARSLGRSRHGPGRGS